MASRYLLIEFDNSEQADALRAQIDAATRRGKRFRVVGLFSKPGPRFCQCGKYENKRGQQSTLKRGEKFGWYVCTECKLPAPIMSHLKNLIKPSDIINPPKSAILNSRTHAPTDMGFYTYGLNAQTLSQFETSD